MHEFIYEGIKTKEISFPLGGIGTGCIGLAGNGRLVDWEIYNRPNKGSTNSFSHFAIKAERNDEVLDARVLNGDLPAPYTGDLSGSRFGSFGFGPNRGTMAGVPHFKDTVFRGEFPFADIRFIDGGFPGSVSLSAFNPFIPLNDYDSSIPAALFAVSIENTTDSEIIYTAALSLGNPFRPDFSSNAYRQSENISCLMFGTDEYDETDPAFGTLCAATDGTDVGYQEYWYRGSWFDNLEIFWREFASPGMLRNRTYDKIRSAGSARAATNDMGTILSRIAIPPNETRKLRFVISWSFPNFTNYWNPEKKDGRTCCGEDCCSSTESTWKNYYATVFEGAKDSAVYALKQWNRLYNETKLFKETLYATTIPSAALEAASANLSVLKTPTCIRLTDGSFYGFEGCHCDSGCCEGSCTHVWNYAYALPFLYPRLERSMRDLDFRYNQRDDGGMAFRLQLPLGRDRSTFRPCADGQFGGVIKTYRDWKICGDDEWLGKNWPAVKKSIEFAWADTNEDRWDHDRDGVLEGRQHHTLDMELFGPNSWLTGFYLAALKAGAEMAEYLGDTDAAEEYRELFDNGQRWVDANLFNGEYYHQLVDIRDKSILERFSGTSGSDTRGNDVLAAYWNDEAKEIKYQIAEGSEIDQLNAQWHANLCGLGDIFDQEQRNKALRSMYTYNFKSSMRNVFNPCRLYCLNDEGGLLICEWPEHTYKPVVPLPYAEETQNGYEYQAAILMIQEGLIEEGMSVVKAIRDRYDGERRNPWNEFECGSNYARSMASFSLIPSFSGFQFDMVKGTIGFDPLLYVDGEFVTFWSLDSGWGLVSIGPSSVELEVRYGSLALTEFVLPDGFPNAEISVTITGESGTKNLTVDTTRRDSTLVFAKKQVIGKGETLRMIG